jgi:hypothetical protein
MCARAATVPSRSDATMDQIGKIMGTCLPAPDAWRRWRAWLRHGLASGEAPSTAKKTSLVGSRRILAPRMSKCRCRINLLICEIEGGAPLELKHDPEKWKPVFRKGHAQTKEIQSWSLFTTASTPGRRRRSTSSAIVTAAHENPFRTEVLPFGGEMDLRCLANFLGDQSPSQHRHRVADRCRQTSRRGGWPVVVPSASFRKS